MLVEELLSREEIFGHGKRRMVEINQLVSSLMSYSQLWAIKDKSRRDERIDLIIKAYDNLNSLTDKDMEDIELENLVKLIDSINKFSKFNTKNDDERQVFLKIADRMDFVDTFLSHITTKCVQQESTELDWNKLE